MRDLVQKALYLGVGIASYAAEKANTNLKELTTQAQKLADTLVERGEMNAEEAKRYVDELIREAQGQSPQQQENPGAEPRRIEIVMEEEDADCQDETTSETPDASRASATSPTTSNHSPEPTAEADINRLRQQVATLQAELERLNRSS